MISLLVLSFYLYLLVTQNTIIYLSCSDAQRERGGRAKQICGSLFNMAKRKEKIIHLPFFNLHILQNELIGSTIRLGIEDAH